jgi:hypothetical protein
LQKEFPDVENNLIVFAFRMTAYEVDEVNWYSQNSKLLSKLHANLIQIRNRTSAVDRFSGWLSALPSPIAPVDGRDSTPVR